MMQLKNEDLPQSKEEVRENIRFVALRRLTPICCIAQIDLSSEEDLKKVHHCLLELNVVTGNLVCTETGRKFPIQAGIPNMLLVQDEL